VSRVLLASVNPADEPYPVYPLGLSMVAAALLAAGHEVRQADLQAGGLEGLARTADDLSPEVIGLSVRNVDNVDYLSGGGRWYVDAAREAVAALRRVSAAPIMLGGAGFSLLPEAILDYTGADHGVVGEGERACCELVAALGRGEAAPRLMRGTQRLDGKDIPAPAIDGALLRHYHAASGLAGVQTKRGCPHSCAYCSYPSLEGRAVRAREPQAVVEEMRRLAVDFGVREVVFTDSVFNDPHGHYLALAEELARRPTGQAWSAFLQPRGLGREELSLLVRSGLKAVELGTDAASEATLAGLGKHFDFGQVADLQQLCAQLGLPACHYVVFGGPGETPQTVRQGLANLERLEGAVVMAFTGLRLHRDTRLFERAVAEGLAGPGDDLLRPVYYFSPDIDPRELGETLAAAFRGRRDRIFPPAHGQELMAAMRRLGYRGILWDTLIRRPRAPRPAPADAG
jgi:radical SAM superfamily enzyme YgiQ (UPF0313 family)